MLVVPKSYPEFLAQSGKKLGLKAPQYAYLSTGQEVSPSMLEELEEDAEIYISEREGFFRNATGRPGSYKLALLGAGGAGKSCLTIKYIKGAFTEVYDPSIEDSFRHHVTCDGTPCILEVLDTAGQEEYKCIAEQWVKKKQGFILVYSIIDEVSFQNLKSFYDLIRDEYLDGEDGEIPPIMLVGNKVDLERQRQVSTKQGRDLAVAWGAKFFETSAKTNENVEATFEGLIRLMRMRERRGAGGDSSSLDRRSSGGCTLL